MELGRYVDEIHAQLESAAQAGGEEAQALARLLAAPLDSAVRLALLDALATAAEEITVELVPGSVELRLHGREPQFVVTPPPADPPVEEPAGEEGEAEDRRAAAGDEGGVARVNVRMPERMKARVDRAADAEGLSINSWLVRAAAARLERSEGGHHDARRAPQGAQRYTGWAR